MPQLPPPSPSARCYKGGGCRKPRVPNSLDSLYDSMYFPHEVKVALRPEITSCRSLEYNLTPAATGPCRVQRTLGICRTERRDREHSPVSGLPNPTCNSKNREYGEKRRTHSKNGRTYNMSTPPRRGHRDGRRVRTMCVRILVAVTWPAQTTKLKANVAAMAYAAVPCPKHE